jgi:hypothetical protein
MDGAGFTGGAQPKGLAVQGLVFEPEANQPQQLSWADVHQMGGGA